MQYCHCIDAANRLFEKHDMIAVGAMDAKPTVALFENNLGADKDLEISLASMAATFPGICYLLLPML